MRIKGELVKASELRGPSISGTVSVPLAELDSMRVAHAEAVALAQELESKQMLVKVIFQERKEVREFVTQTTSKWDTGRYITDTKYEEKDVEYRNLDLFRGIIAEEERHKVLKELNDKEKSNIELMKKVSDSQDVIHNILAREEEGLKRMKELEKTLETTTKTANEILLKEQHLEETLKVQMGIKTGLERRLEELTSVLHDKTIGGKLSRLLGIW